MYYICTPESLSIELSSAFGLLGLCAVSSAFVAARNGCSVHTAEPPIKAPIILLPPIKYPP